MGQFFRSQFFRSQVFNSQSFSIVPDPSHMADRIMQDPLMQYVPVTDAEALKLLRASFPDCSLSQRVAALDFLMRRKSRNKSRNKPNAGR